MSRAIQSPHRSARRQTISRKSSERRILNGGESIWVDKRARPEQQHSIVYCQLLQTLSLIYICIFAGTNNKTRRETRRRRQIHINSHTYYYRIWSRPDSRDWTQETMQISSAYYLYYSLANRDWSAIRIWYQSIWNGHTKFPINDNNKSARNISCVSLFIYSLARITGQIY